MFIAETVREAIAFFVRRAAHFPAPATNYGPCRFNMGDMCPGTHADTFNTTAMWWQ
jgi:hypothetical protein